MKAWWIFLALTLSCAAQPPNWVSREQWGSKPLPMSEAMLHTPARVTLHHAGVLWKDGDDAFKKIRALQAWGQSDKHWPDLPYHFLIDPEGRIFEGRDMKYRPESNTQYDLNGVINVHLWGHFDEQRVTVAQLRATVELLAYLRDRYHLSELQTHRQAAPGQTTCPGHDFVRYYESGQLQDWVDECHDGQLPAIWTLP